MKLLNTYDDRDDAETAAEKLRGEKRLASERDATVVIYNLFGTPNCGTFHRLNMYNLSELKSLLDRRNSWRPNEQRRQRIDRPWMGPCPRTRHHHGGRCRRRCRR